MTIKEAEERTGLSRSNIRFYEKEGLIRPQRNTGNRYRDYSERDIEELQKIACLRTLGISIEDIRRVAGGQANLYVVIQGQIPRLEQQMSELQNARRMCEKLLAQGPIEYKDLEIDRYIGDPKEYWWENRRILGADSMNFISIWGGKAVWMIITAVCLLTALGALPFLPEQIPIQWSGGEAVSFADRWTILAYPAVCGIIRLMLRPVIGTWVRRYTLYGSAVTDYVVNSLCFATLSAEVFMILFVRGFVRQITVVLLAEILILAGFLWAAGRELPAARQGR